MGTLEVDKLDPQSGTALEIGTSGDTATIPSGATLTVAGTLNVTGSITATDKIDSAHYAAGSIDNEHIADDAINSEHYADGSIDLAHMSSQSVDEDNLYISNSGSNGQALTKQSGNSGGLTWATVAPDYDTGIIFNESGNDVDFRFESDDNANRFFINGGDNTVLFGTTNAEAGLLITRNSANNGYPSINFSKSRSTSPGGGTIVQDNDNLGRIAFHADDGGDLLTPGASIQVKVDGTPGANDMPTEMIFATTADGANDTTDRMKIRASGIVEIVSGKIDFPDSASLSSDANVLDDYQEGTMSLSSSQASGWLTGFYTKIGRMVYWTAAGTVPTSGNSATQTITGMPLTCKNQAGPEGSDSGAIWVAYTSSTSAAEAIQNNNSTTWNFYLLDNNVATHATFSAKHFIVGGIYTTDS